MIYKDDYKMLDFKIPPVKFRESSVWQLDNTITEDLPEPLLDIGIYNIAFARKRKYTEKNKRLTPQHTFALVIQGELTITSGDRKFVHRPGMLSCCPANEPHIWYAEKPTCWMYWHLYDKPLWAPLKRYGIYERRYEWTHLLLTLFLNLIDSANKGALDDRLKAVEYSKAIADILKREIGIMSDTSKKGFDNLTQLVSEIQSSPVKHWSVDEMARIACMSKRSLHRQFQNKYGIGPVDMVIKKRLDLAIEKLIHTEDKIEDISSSLDYRSPFSFSNLFMRHFGLRPSAFREKYRSGSKNLIP